MRCPRCHLVPPEPAPACNGCGFTLSGLADDMSTAPERSGVVVDQAGVLSEAGAARVATRLQGFTAGGGHDAVVITVAATAPITPAEYAFGLFNTWRVGGTSGDGLLLLIAVAEQRVQCELGPRLGPALPDAVASSLLARHAVPHLTRGDFDLGVFHGVDMLARLLEHAEGRR